MARRRRPNQRNNHRLAGRIQPVLELTIDEVMADLDAGWSRALTVIPVSDADTRSKR